MQAAYDHDELVRLNADALEQGFSKALPKPSSVLARDSAMVKLLKAGRYLQQALICYIRESLFQSLGMNLNPIKGFAWSVDGV